MNRLRAALVRWLLPEIERQSAAQSGRALDEIVAAINQQAGATVLGLDAVIAGLPPQREAAQTPKNRRPHEGH